MCTEQGVFTELLPDPGGTVMEPTGVRTGVRVGVRAAMGVLDTVLTAPAAPALPVVTLAEIAERVPPGEVDIPRRDRKTGEATGEVLIPTSSPCPTCVLDAIADTGTCTRFVVGNLGMTGGVFERTIIDAGSVPFFFQTNIVCFPSYRQAFLSVKGSPCKIYH